MVGESGEVQAFSQGLFRHMAGPRFVPVGSGLPHWNMGWLSAVKHDVLINRANVEILLLFFAGGRVA